MFTGPVLVMVAFGVVLLAACLFAVRWRGYAFALPDWERRDPTVVDRPVVQLVWLLAVGGLTGGAVGTLVVGPAGRLAMRLLAAASPDATGFLTEADERIGEITVAGSMAFIVFVGIPFGLSAGLLYVFVSTALPRGPLGGLLYGAGLLVVFGSTLDPLRGDNEDFALLDRGWLAVVTFTAMALVTGVCVSAFAGRIAAALPAPSLWWALWLLPSGLLTILVFAFVPIVGGIVLLGCLVFLVVAKPGDSSLARLARLRGRTALRGVVAAVVLVSLPAFVLALDDILGG